MLSPDEIAARLEAVRERMRAAARRAGRDTESVRLVLASKTQPPEAIRAAYAAGAREFGENYVQEAIAKREPLNDLSDLRWHLIGHLQRNKARLAAASFAMIQTLDSEALAQALAHAREVPPPPVLIEINLGGETSKSGIAPDAAAALIGAVRGLVEVRGLMTIPPLGQSAAATRRSFARLRELRDHLAPTCKLALSDLSMGMSDDFEVAIEEGATIVRIGRAVFGERGK
ncbi:MAG TPA: YggS family pyridoxal phosphate-dependent enzyme [Candidatus Binataceae bacterium]|nr:YggS family pyridoxal phosphate-dependent enzyme [Candidatus Binataceae bacterium]